jgi:hypothetical protein
MRFLFRPRPIHICQKMELKSRWTVPLNTYYITVNSYQVFSRRYRWDASIKPANKNLPNLFHLNWHTKNLVFAKNLLLKIFSLRNILQYWPPEIRHPKQPWKIFRNVFFSFHKRSVNKCIRGTFISALTVCVYLYIYRGIFINKSHIYIYINIYIYIYIHADTHLPFRLRYTSYRYCIRILLTILTEI